jgi:hypothetical protein
LAVHHTVAVEVRKLNRSSVEEPIGWHNRGADAWSRPSHLQSRTTASFEELNPKRMLSSRQRSRSIHSDHPVEAIVVHNQIVADPQL